VRFAEAASAGGGPAGGTEGPAAPGAGPGGFPEGGDGGDGDEPEIIYPEEELVLTADTGERLALRSGDAVGRLALGAGMLRGSPTVSRRHLEAEFRGGRWYVRNLSPNGTYVNGAFADEGEELEVRPGDEIMLSSLFRLTVGP
jgi:hypothetical protein